MDHPSVRDSVVRLQWGDHVCHLFDQAEDLGEILVPYFKVGLERNEVCLWVTSSPYGKDRAVSEMRAAVPVFDQRAAAGQMQIIGFDDWYTKQGALTPAETIRNWMVRKDEAVSSGYTGLRITGNTSFVDEGMWNDFMDYERAFDSALKGQRILTLCSYCLAKRSSNALLEVMCTHGLSLTRRGDHWQLLDFKRHGHAPQTPDERLEATGSQWSALREIIEAEFIAADPGRIALEGSPVELSRGQATRLALVIQELAANSTMHGALSSPQGKITIQWRLSTNGSRRVYITWIESGLSKLVIPEKVGFGTPLIAGLVENYERVFKPDGMSCSFELGLTKVQ